ncbi:MAG: alpha/beta hydrolase fold domain-containing protein [Rubrivivax sp.]
MRPRTDPAWLEAQYNNRARVADHARFFAGWAEASALVRRKARCVLDVRYGAGPKATLDVFPADAAAASAAGDGSGDGGGGAGAPVLVVIHGGYWRSLDKSDFSFVAPSFTADGAMVVVPNHDLCPAVGVQDIARQLTEAVAWTVRHAAEHGGDPQRIALAGHSAGGHLVAMLLSCRWKEVAETVGFELPAQPLAGGLAISGLYDLEPIRHVPSLQADLKLTPLDVARCSPAFFPRPKGCKLYATVGLNESEEFLRQNTLIRDVWGPTAVPVCETLPGLHHFSVLESLADPQGRLHELALRLLGLR